LCLRTITQFGQGADQRHALPLKPCLSFNFVDPNQRIEYDLIQQAQRKRQATEDPEYEIKTQEAMDSLHSGRIRAAATALSRK